MPSLNIFATATALLAASAVIAAPASDIEAPRLQGRSTFTVPQVENAGFKGFIASGSAARAKAYAKYGKPLPVDLAAAVSAAASKGA